jgi:hypothetical protein
VNEFRGNFSWALMSHNVQKLRELIIGSDVTDEFILHLFVEIHPSHHDDFFPSHIGFEVVESFWKIRMDWMAN